jgi:hypothetical protein
MLITTGRVHNGKIEVDHDSLPEGARVTVLALDGDETFDLDGEDEAKLLEAIAGLDQRELPLCLR